MTPKRGQHHHCTPQPPTPRRLAILGSTGSLGVQTLELCEHFPDRLQVVALGASGRHPQLLADQVRRFSPGLVAVTEPGAAARLRAELGTHPGPLSLPAAAPQVVAGPQALTDAALHPDADLVLVLTVGLTGLAPTLAALEAGRRVALANKEVLVAAGDLIPAPRLVEEGRLLPVDSEHSAIWQSLLGERRPGIRRLWLTASGGPFWGWPPERLRTVTAEQSLAHPTWRMGPRVTVDSATLMNKGFEIIEAHHLFGVPCADVRVVVHRQSVVHSLVEFCDGSIKAQLSLPDMRLPLLFALSYPERWEYQGPPPLFEPGARSRRAGSSGGAGSSGRAEPLTLTFEPLVPGENEPRAIRLARQAAEAGGTYPTVLATADEVAVEAFLAGRLRFDRLLEVVRAALDRHTPAPSLSLEAVQEADAWARRTAQEVIDRLESA